MKNSPNRGFKELIGETIIKIDASAINFIRVECASGKVVNIEAEPSVLGIPAITAYDARDSV